MGERIRGGGEKEKRNEGTEVRRTRWDAAATIQDEKVVRLPQSPEDNATCKVLNLIFFFFLSDTTNSPL